jgi:hypothetical protein
MSSSAELQLAYKVSNAPINLFPYPHFVVHDVFPADFYASLQRNLPRPDALRTLEEARGVAGYDERFVLEFKPDQLAALEPAQREFWSSMHSWLVGGRFANLMLSKFSPFIRQRFGDAANVRFYDEALLVQDTTNYKLGPHTDAPRKVLTLLFYLPRDLSQQHLGTSIYLPKDRDFRCPGGPHHPHEMFDRVWTVPFVPNTLFVFFKNDVSFHGVEPVRDSNVRRWLLLYDIFQRPAA